MYSSETTYLTTDLQRRARLTGRLRIGLLYVLCVPLCAGLATARGLEVSGFNYTGWMWVVLLATGLLILATEKALNRSSHISFPYTRWAAWFGYVVLSLIWCETVGLRNIQVALQISMPLFVGIAAALFVTSEAQLTLLLRAFAWTLPLLALAVVAGHCGFPDGINLQEHLRPMGLSLVLIGCVSIARCPTPVVIPLIGWMTCLALVASTGARLATAILLVMPVLHPCFKRRLARVIAIAGVAGLGFAIFYTPAFQQRFFYSGTGTLSQLAQGNVRDSGRFEAWGLVWEAAREHPILGAGVGSAYRFVPTVWPEMNHVHNEYLRVVFEFGFVGLAVFLGVLLWQCGDIRRHIARSDGVLRCAFIASLLGLYVLIIASVTGNVISTNLLFMNPLFALMGAAYGVAGRRCTDAGEAAFQEKGICYVHD